MSKQSRGQLGEEKVIEALSKMRCFYRLINNLTLQKDGGNTHQIDHIFICEKGVFVIESKSLYGQIIADTSDTVWQKIERNKKVSMHNPIIQNKSHVRIIKSYLGNDIDIISIVVFTLNNAPIIKNENVINLKDLNRFINGYKNKQKINEKQIEMIYQYLLRKESDASMQEHLENIKKIKEERKIRQSQITYALENRSCPICKNKITEIKKNYFKCAKCDFNFHL